MNLQHAFDESTLSDLKQKSNIFMIKMRRDGLQKIIAKKRRNYFMNKNKVDLYLTKDIQELLRRGINQFDDIGKNEDIIRNLIKHIGDDVCFYKSLADSGFLAKLPSLIKDCLVSNWKNKTIFNDCLSMLLIIASHAVLFRLETELFCNKDFLKSILELSLKEGNVFVIVHLNNFLTSLYIECYETNKNGVINYFKDYYLDQYYETLRNTLGSCLSKKEYLVFMESVVESLIQLKSNWEVKLACEVVC